MNLPIKFGTDGWRGIIADSFTFENVRYAAQATADYFKTVEGRQRATFIGFDVRFQSENFARAVAEEFAGNGLRVVMLDRPYPTPYVSFEVRRREFAGGIMITASHNPAIFNGFKVKAHFGGSATPTITAKIEAAVAALYERRQYGGPESQSAMASSLKERPPLQSEIEIIGPEKYYSEHMQSLVDWDRISKSKLKIVVDSMHGCGGYILENLLAGTSCTVRTIRGDPDPLFGGISPEPMMPQLQPRAGVVRQSGRDVGLATDGAADRLGIVDDTGRYVNTMQTLSHLLLHVYRNKGWRGEARAIATATC